MSASAKTIEKQAMELTREERARIAQTLLRPLHDEEPEEAVQEAWKATLTRRMAEVASGEVELVPGHKVDARIRKALAKRRRE